MKNMKILLMVPVTSSMRHVPRFSDIGLGYLAAAAKRAGHDIRLLSWNMDLSVENFKNHIYEKQFYEKRIAA